MGLQISGDTYTWIDGSPLTFQPQIVGHRDQCYTVRHASDLEGAWDDYECVLTNPYICKITGMSFRLDIVYNSI